MSRGHEICEIKRNALEHQLLATFSSSTEMIFL